MQKDAKPLRFPLSSEQCELLAAFEDASSLTELASKLRRDVSVISRQLSALASDAPVIEKRDGRWRMTAFGRQINNLSRAVVASQHKILRQHSDLRLGGAALPSANEAPALLVIGMQQGFDDPHWGARNNPQAEERVAEILTAWRRAGWPVVHCQHVSKQIGSPLRAGSVGSDFKPEAKPKTNEKIVQKAANCAFVGTDLEEHLKKLACNAVVIVGFTTNHCVDVTARMAGDLGYQAFVVNDATAAFDRVGWDGRVFKAEDLHSATLANLSQEFATIVSSESLLAHLTNSGIAEA